MTITHAVQVSDLEFSWQPHARPIITLPALSVPYGESLFIHGASGSGKSTLLNLLSGVLSAKHGEVMLMDKPFSTLSQGKRDQVRADHLGYIFQQFNLLPYLSVIDNVLLPVRLSTARRNNVAETGSTLTDAAEYWLAQLKIPTHLLYEKVSKLSVGQQQRVAAARALIGSPEIIIADEPTSALDQQNVDNFMSVLVEQCRNIGSSLVFVSHDRHLSQYFDATFALPSSQQEGNE